MGITKRIKVFVILIISRLAGASTEVPGKQQNPGTSYRKVLWTGD